MYPLTGDAIEDGEIMRMLTSSRDTVHSGTGSEVWSEEVYLQNPFFISLALLHGRGEMAALASASHSPETAEPTSHGLRPLRYELKQIFPPLRLLMPDVLSQG
jgi:hypothetical protein